MYQSWTWMQAILWTVARSHEFWLSTGYWLTMAQNQYTARQSYTAMYQSWTWLQATLWTVVCSRDFLCIGWLLAGY